MGGRARPVEPDELMPASDIVRCLRKYRYDPAWRKSHKVPIRRLAKLAGVDPDRLYSAMRGEPMAQRIHMKLSTVIGWVERGEVRFYMSGFPAVWQVEFVTPREGALAPPRPGGPLRRP